MVAGLLLEFAAMSKSVEKKGCLVARLTILGEQGLIHICMQDISSLFADANPTIKPAVIMQQLI